MSSATIAAEERCHPIGSEIKVGFYHIIKTIGKGNTAIVKLARHSITKSEVAIKIIDKSMFDSPSSLDKIRREINILKFLKHPNVIKLYQVMESDKFIYIVSEFAPKGEIFEYISRNGRFSEAEAKIKFAQILNAVDYCHKLGIVHRDLKAENLLLDENFNVKLADFGFGNFYQKDSKLSTWCGSPPYAAPEIFEGRTYYGPEVDVWALRGFHPNLRDFSSTPVVLQSLGVILYVLVCGMLPFDGSNLRVIRDRVVSGRFRIPYFMSMECERLVRKILVVDPRKRYTMQQIQQHSWIHATLSSTSSQLLEESFREQLVVTGRGISMNCHEIVLRKMEGANISKEQVIKSLETHAYDNFTAIYELLMDKIAKNLKNHPMSRLEAAGLRRPSMISEQAIVSVRHQSAVQTDTSPNEIKPPVLAETREAVFSQTTDGVQLQEVVGPLCQLQQRIRTDEQSENMSTVAGVGSVVICGGSPVRSKLIRSTRLGMTPGLTRVKQLVSQPTHIASSSIDEGVETEVEVDNCNLSVARSVGQTDQPLTNSMSVAVYNKPAQPPCKPSISIDSNIEIDIAGSNLSLSSPASWSVPSANVVNGSTVGALYQVVHGEIETAHYEQEQHGKAAATCNGPEKEIAAFHSGRRGSEGLVAKDEFAKPSALLLKNRAYGVAELRKELVKLQNETMDQMQHRTAGTIENNATNSSYKLKSLMRDQRSLEETLLTKNCSGPKILATCSTKRTLPYNRQTHLVSPMECPSSAPRPHSPLRGAVKRQLGPMRSVPHHQHLHYVYGQHVTSGHPFYGEHFSSASNSPTRGGKVYATLSGSPMSLGHQSFDSGFNPLFNLQQQNLTSKNDECISANLTNPTDANTNVTFNKTIPVCHSHNSLLPNIIYDSPTRCRYNVQSSLSATSSTSSSPLPAAPSQTLTSVDDVGVEDDSSAKHINIPIVVDSSERSYLDPNERQACFKDDNKRSGVVDIDVNKNVKNNIASRNFQNIDSTEFATTDGNQMERRRHSERRMRFGLVQQQQVCGSEEEMITSLANSPEDKD